MRYTAEAARAVHSRCTADIFIGCAIPDTSLRMNVLGVESSCDETAVAVVADGRRLLSNVLASQVEVHARYGGVVPEIASRQHLLQLLPMLRLALERSGLTLDAIDGVAATVGPGLAGSLLVGFNAAKALAFARGLPFVGVNHLEGHIYAAWLEGDPEAHPGFPLLCLVASGGHTDLILMEGHGQFRLLGRTRDDAAGEAFDKAARILDLGFPGGPAIQRIAQGAAPAEPLPRAWLPGSLDFSFSGVKTALLYRAQREGIYPPAASSTSAGPSEHVRRLAAAFQESVVEVMVVKTLEAARAIDARGILLGGGVAANELLRQSMRDKSPLPLFVPSPALCTDNAAMIAACGYYHLRHAERHGWDLDVAPSLRLGGG